MSHEHDFEEVRGLPERLPEGERILWQGEPDWKILARRVFHAPLVAAYFAVLVGWRVIDASASGVAPGEAFVRAIPLMLFGGLALVLLVGLAAVNAKTTVYTITNKRVVFRIGAALTKAINIPFTIVEAAAVKHHKGAAGDVAISLKAPNKIGYFHLWPHARPDRLKQPQPTFRCLANADEAAEILAGALRAELGEPARSAAAPAPARPPRERPEPVGARPATA